MNIIQLFSLLDLKTGQILEFGTEDYIRIEKKINFEKKINPEIDANAGENLISALKEYKEELLFIMTNRVFFNFFTHNNFPKSYFFNNNRTVSDEKIKHFITLFLAEDLISFFSFKLSKSWYHYLEELDFLLDLKIYFPEEVIYKMASLVFSKLDFAIFQLRVLSNNDISSINYIQHKTFYYLLSHFATIELDRKMSNLLSLVIQFYEKKTNILFFTCVVKSMAFYNDFNGNITKILIQNRDAVSKFRDDAGNNKVDTATSLVIAVVCVVIFFLLIKCS
ncbi:hypothetical protein AB9T88_05910 [Flavobacterium sp. LBUM151]